MKNKTWTIMIYMAGDNNLSVDMAYAMQQIKDLVRDDGSVNLLVYYDGYSSAIPTLYCDYSDPANFRLVRSKMFRKKLYPVAALHDESAADPRSVINFVDWCVNKVEYEVDGELRRGRKADRYGLIFSGHSMGFQDIGLFRDETADRAMTMEEMNDLLERITLPGAELSARAGDLEPGSTEYERETKEILGRKLDILGFDSCVMSMLEVGYQFASVAETMVASEGSVPSAGWTYAKILGGLAKSDAELSSQQIAANFVNEFVRSQDSYTIGGVSVDMAAWDLDKLPRLTTEFGKLAETILGCFEEPGSTIYRQMERVILQVHWKCQSYMYDQNVDLGDFCELLREEAVSLTKEVGGEAEPVLKEIAVCCDAVLRELSNVVILSGFSGGLYQYSNGVSLFFPWSLGALEVSLENYEGLEFVRETEAGRTWFTFLVKYLNQVALRRAAGPTKTGAEPSGVVLENAMTAGSKLRYLSYVYKDYTEPAQAASEGDGKIAGQEGTKIAGMEGTKIAGQEGTKIAGQEGTKIAGQEGTKIAGQEGTKIAGQEGTKIAGMEGTKIAGQEGTKIAGMEGTKIAGMEGTKLAGGGNTSFFETFKQFKNIETPWNISGFTKDPKSLSDDSGSESAAG